MGTSMDAGTAVAHYRIIGPIGAGGMGEVFKAHDTTLERTIALKILPPDVVRNEERLRRFMQEARSASSLNHPHIVTIYEIGEALVPDPQALPGETGRTIHYIAMELIDGSTLRRKIHQEQADLRTILGYLAQAAEGLAKAHAAGIVHRDLKPENVMVSTDGFAKVLDFGLAKLSARQSAPGESNSTTAVRNQTGEGVILGTVAYMSPEQVQGRVVDHRSDIFSFGAILYEAATRQRPFDADSDVEVMHKILHDKPQPVDEIDSAVPAELRRLIRRCLAKDPDKRFHSMKDLAIELREIVDEYEEMSASASSRTSGSVSGSVMPPPATTSRTAIIAVVVAALVTVTAIVFSVQQWRQARSQAAAPVAFSSMKFQPVTSSGNVVGAVISPDGKYVAHVSGDTEGSQELFIRQVATGSDVQVTRAGLPVMSISFSPDGSYLYYTLPERTEGGQFLSMYQVPAFGGTPRKVAYDVDTAVTFSPDGKQIAFGRGAPHVGENYYVVANLDGTEERVVAKFPRLDRPMDPIWSSDGNSLLTNTRIPPSGQVVQPVEIDIATGEYREIGDSEWWWIGSMALMPDSKSLVMAALPKGAPRVQIWLQPLPGGDPIRVTNDLNNYEQVSVTQDGRTLAILHSEINGRFTIVGQSGAIESEVPAELRSRNIGQVSASRSGAIAMATGDQGTANVAIIDSPESPLRFLTDDGVSWDPSITADGRTVFFVSEPAEERPHIFSIGADGSGRRQITSGEGEYEPLVSPDGRVLLYYSGDALWKMSLDGGTPEKIVDRPAGDVAVSPDSMHIAYFHWKKMGEDEPDLYLRIEPLAGGNPLINEAATIDRQIAWTRQQNEIGLVMRVNGVPNIFRRVLDGSEPVQVTNFTSGEIESFDWLQDGRLVVIRGERKGDVVLITDFN